jgi:hypothetical protein
MASNPVQLGKVITDGTVGGIRRAKKGVAGQPPSGPAFELPTFRYNLNAGSIACWHTHNSTRREELPGSSWDKDAIINWRSGHLYSARRCYTLHGFRLITANPGRIYDWHTQPDDPGGGFTPPCNPAGVAPFAIDYFGGNGMELVAEPEDAGCSGGSGNYHMQIFTQAQIEARRNVWTWLWVEMDWGRSNDTPDGSARVWVAGEETPRVTRTNINTFWPTENQITFWEGAYISSGFPASFVCELAATRFGRTPQECYEDQPIFSQFNVVSGVGSSQAITKRLSTEAAVPAALQW